MKILIVLTLLPTIVYAKMMGSFRPPQEPFYVSNYCLVRKELPSNVKFSFKKSENENVAELLTTTGNFTISKSLKDPLILPLSLRPNHLPVAVLTKGKDYYGSNNDFYKSVSNNLLRLGFTEYVIPGGQDPISLVTNIEDISEKELKTFVEVPLKYYVGNQYIENKLKISLIKNQIEEFTTYKFSKIEAVKPLPANFKIDGGDFHDLKKTSMYGALKFTNNGSIPVVFVREFIQPVLDQPLLKESKIPIYISEKGQCFELAIDHHFVLSRETGKKSYDKFYKIFDDIFKSFPMNDESISYLNAIKNKDLYEVFPLEHVLNGNGRVAKDCKLEFSDFSHIFAEKEDFKKFNDDSQKQASDSQVKEVTIPNESIVELDVDINGIKSKLHLIKRFVLNENWRPSQEIEKDRLGCEPFCPNIFVKKKVDFLKDTKINYPTSSYKNEELICGMPGNNDYEYSPRVGNEDPLVFY